MTDPEASINDPTLDNLTARMAEILPQTLNKTQTQNQIAISEVSAAPIGITLNSSNYALWSQVLEMYISGKDKLGYINGDITQPPTTDPTWRKWRTEIQLWKAGWLIPWNQAWLEISSDFLGQKRYGCYCHYFLWRHRHITDIWSKKRATKMRQNGGSIEAYYNGLQSLWRKIDFRRPNPMMCAIDIQKFNSISQEDRVYTFLDGWPTG